MKDREEIIRQTKHRVRRGSVEWWMARGLKIREAKISAAVYQRYIECLETSGVGFAKDVEEVMCPTLVRLVERHGGCGARCLWSPEVLLAFEFDVSLICLEIAEKFPRRWPVTDEQGGWEVLAAQIAARFEKVRDGGYVDKEIFREAVPGYLSIRRQRRE